MEGGGGLAGFLGEGRAGLLVGQAGLLGGGLDLAHQLRLLAGVHLELELGLELALGVHRSSYLLLVLEHEGRTFGSAGTGAEG